MSIGAPAERAVCGRERSKLILDQFRPGDGFREYPLESRRLIYAELIMKDRDQLDLMATTFVDGDASEAFFGDRWRLSRDVLADGAKEYLKQMKFD